MWQAIRQEVAAETKGLEHVVTVVVRATGQQTLWRLPNVCPVASKDNVQDLLHALEELEGRLLMRTGQIKVRK